MVEIIKELGKFGSVKPTQEFGDNFKNKPKEKTKNVTIFFKIKEKN